MFLLIFLVSLFSCRRGVPAQSAVEATRRATVFVTVNFSGTTATGTGFLAGVHKGVGYVITNRHVVTSETGAARESVRVVFDSGTSSARTTEAQVTFLDAENDLALLSTARGPFPDPINPHGKVPISETLPLNIFGFPFGRSLTAGKTPEITIGKGSISSLRRDEAGEVFAIQVDGDLNPGNSGGPLVSLDGGLVGVAVAKIAASNIAFAIPAARVADLVNGQSSSLALDETEVSEGSSTWNVRAVLLDPLEKITRVEVLTAPASSFPREPKPQSGGRYGPLLADARRVPLARAALWATGTLAMTGMAVDTDYYVQLEVSRKEEATFFTQPLRVTAHFSGDSGRVLRPGMLRAQFASDGRVNKGALAGKSSAAAEADARDTTVPLPCPVDDVLVAGDGRFLVLKLGDLSALGVYDTELKRLTRMIPGPSRNFLVAAGGDVALVAYGDNQLLTTFDVTTGVLLAADTSPFAGQITGLVMGHASSREALLVVRGKEAGLEAGYLLDVRTLKPVVPPDANAGGVLDIRWSSFLHDATVGADSKLQTLVVWRDRGGTAAVMDRNGDRFPGGVARNIPAPVFCGDDGRIYAPGSVLGRDGVPIFQVPGMLYPGVGGASYLALLPDGTLHVYLAGSSEELGSAGTYPGWSDTPRASPSRPPLDRRGLVVFDASRNRIVFVRKDREALIQRDISLMNLLEGSEGDYLVVVSSPPSSIRTGSTLTYQIQALSKSSGISYVLEFGPPGMSVSPSGLVKWNVPQRGSPGLSREVSAVITLRSASGKQVFHNLRISVE
ncbi:MAG: serine protease [Thermoanaerobaculia bacterium]|nr:serine protease [Thermoanaerobaculia bacterium]